MTNANKIKLYEDVQAMNCGKELIAEMNANDETVYSLGILENNDVADDIYHNGWK